MKNDSAEIYRAGHTLRSIPAEEAEEPRSTQPPDKSLGLVGAIRVNAEAIVERNAYGMNLANTQRIIELCEELEEVLVTNQLERSLERSGG